MTLAAATAGGCAREDNAPPLASVSVSVNRDRVPVGSPIELTYRFTVGPDTRFDGDYTVFLHALGDGHRVFDDDHQPPIPTSKWQPGQRIEYTRARFVPVVPHVGAVAVEAGLYRGDERLPLQGPEAFANERTSGSRAYRVGTLELLPSSENVFIIYKTGWHPPEFGPDPSVSWQWSQKAGVVSFANPKADATLYLEFDARPELFPDGPQQITLSIGGHEIGRLTADSPNRTLKQVPITAARLGSAEMVDLTVETDRTFVPARLPAAGRDLRELGIRVYNLSVERR
jgi:hypothetical protein